MNKTGTIHPNTARTNNTHPLESFKAADAMNEGDNLKQAQLEALSMLSRSNGRTAKAIGLYAAVTRGYAETIRLADIEDIIRVSQIPHRRMSELVALDLAERKGSLCFITELGRRALK